MSSNEVSERPSSPSEAPAAEPVTFTVKSSHDQKYTLSLPLTTPVLEVKNKLAEMSEIPADMQRLIYSGRVMKDEETLATYKVQSGNTVHMVKGAASNANRGAAAGGPASTGNVRPAVPTNIAAGSGNNPLTGLTGARYAGHVQLPSADMFGPDGGMGPPPDPEQLAQAMNNPLFQGTMNEMLRNPQLLDYIIASNPMLQQLGPEARRLMQSDMFRQMMTNPDVIRQMSQMGGSLGGRGFGGMGGMGGIGGIGGAPTHSFPEPGRTDTTPAPPGETGSGTAAPPNPFGVPGAPNPFAALFSVPPVGSSPVDDPSRHPYGFSPAMLNQLGLTAGTPSTASQGAPPPMLDPAAMSALFSTMGQQGGLGGLGTPPAVPVDNRPPEDRYSEQLRQLNDMGFFDFDRNVEALRRSGGSVQGAISQLLGG